MGTWEDLQAAIDEEGLGYFLLYYTSPEEVEENYSDPKVDRFVELWREILGPLRELEELWQ